MSIPTGPIRRLEQLETLAQRQRELLYAEREASFKATRWVHLAKTIRVGVNYPTSGNTFGLQFIDREFTPTQGVQAVTDHTRSATKQAVGRTLDGRYLDEGTVVLAVPTPKVPDTSGKGRWCIMPLTPKFECFLGKTSGTISGYDAGTGTNGSGSVARWKNVAGTESAALDAAGNPIVDSNVQNKWPAIAANKWVIYAKLGDQFYIVSPSAGPSVQVYLGQAYGAITGPNGSGTVERLVGGTEAPTGTFDAVVNKFPAIADGQKLIYADIDGTYYIVSPSGGGGGTDLVYFTVPTDRNPANATFSVTFVEALGSRSPTLTAGAFTIWDGYFKFPRAMAGGHGVVCITPPKAVGTCCTASK
jgi:hypothetical protein